MKVCKNCGQQTDDDRVRCPACGHVFEADIDAVLSRMKSDLNDCKAGYLAQPAAPVPQPVQPLPQPVQAQPVQPQTLPVQQAQSVQQAQPADVQAAAPAAPQPAGGKEQYDMMATLAEMSGEIRALHNEIGRMQAMPYAQGPYFRSSGGQYYGAPKQGKLVKVRSTNRIVLSAINIILIAVSVALFFGTWVNFTVAENAYSFKGFDAVRYLLGQDAASFGLYLSERINIGGGDAWYSVFSEPVRYVIRFGIPVYFAFVALGFPALFSLGGKFVFKGWHSAFAWLSFLVALLLFGLFWWVAGLRSMSWAFLLGGGVHFVRGVMLAFYSKDTDLKLVDTAKKEPQAPDVSFH